jgi:hypothetical protein
LKIFRPGLPATLLIAELFDTIFVVIIKYMWLELNLNNIKKFDQKSCDILMIYRIFSCSANGPYCGGLENFGSTNNQGIGRRKAMYN